MALGAIRRPQAPFKLDIISVVYLIIPPLISIFPKNSTIVLPELFSKRIPVIFAGKAVNGGNAKKAYDILLNSENENKNDSILKRFGIETSHKL